MVNAAATAVFCTSMACIVGAAGVPQALMSRAMTMSVRAEEGFMLGEDLLLNLAIGVTTTEGRNTVIFHNNFPTALCDVEAAECFEVLFAGDKGSSTILSNRARKAIASDDQVSTLTQSCHHIHRQNNRSCGFGLIGDREICRRSLPGSQRLITNILIVCVICIRGRIQ